MRRLSLGFASGLGLVAASLASPCGVARADDGPMQVPVTAAGFGNLSMAEGSAERSMANWVDRSGDAYGHYVGVPTSADRDVGVYRPPSSTTIYVLPPPREYHWSTSGSSYDVRPLYTPYAAPLPAPARTTVYTPPCPCAPPRR